VCVKTTITVFFKVQNAVERDVVYVNSYVGVYNQLAESMSEESYPRCLPSGGYVSGSKLLQSVFCENFVSPGSIGSTVNVNEISEDRIVQN
jgi:hypothetical protein